MSDWLNDLLNPLGFDNLTPGATEAQKEKLQEQQRARSDLAMQFSAVFTSVPGRAVLKHLREMTIENSTWCASLGMEKGVPHGFAREGQNALVRYIEERVHEGVTRKQQIKEEKANADKQPAVEAPVS